MICFITNCWMKWINIIVVFLLLFDQTKKPVEKAVIGFYNLENLYDTIDNILVNDDEFIPTGAKNYSGSIYQNKLFKLAYVLNQLGTEDHPRGAAIIGVAELENDTVLNHLVNHFMLRNKQFHFIHFDSRDARGIDVGLLYQPDFFHPYSAQSLQVNLPGSSKDSYYTRDILYVKGQLSGEPIHIYVNHWPSRRGGEDRSAPARAAAANTCRLHMDSIRLYDPLAKIIVMGDLNDNPTDPSILNVLGATGNQKLADIRHLYNPWVAFYQKGFGTLANRDVWGLFDQILISKSWLGSEDSSNKKWEYVKAFIFQQPYMLENTGKYKGYPMRTWDGNQYRGGFSDHFPTYIVIRRR